MRSVCEADVTGPDEDLVDAIEEQLAALPSSTNLGADLDLDFRRRRARIHGRHNEWRRGMPALDNLFDDDAHRGKALAGSLATEMERTVELYGELLTESQGAAAWAATFAVEWRTTASQLPAAWRWDDDAVHVFEAVLEDLTARAVANAEQGVRPRSARPEVEVGRLQRAFIMAGRLLGRFLRPAPRPRRRS